MRDAATLIARVLSQGRRRQAELLADTLVPPHTDLHTVVVPAAIARNPSILTLALALQASPSKELVAALPWPDERRRVRTALAWVEGEHAVRWIRRTWPGLDAACREQFGEIADAPDPTDPAELLAEARARAGGIQPPPLLFGALPAPASPLKRLRRTNVGSRLSDRRRLARRGVLSVPASGPDGAAVNHPGAAGQIEPLAGWTRNVGIPYDEWDVWSGAYRRDYAWAQEREIAPESPLEAGEALPLLPAFAPARQRRRGADTGELDVDAMIEWRCALATGTAPDDAELFAELRPARRATAFALLLDVSASALQHGARSFATGLVHANALAATLSAGGHRTAVFAFRSSSHERVEILQLQAFGTHYEPFGRSLRPSGYTRFGAAIRHAGTGLRSEPADAHVLICLGDAVPADEGYDGPYGRADVAHAVDELRARGVLVRHLVPHERRDGEDLDEMFGAGGWQAATDAGALGTVLDGLAADVRGCAA